MSITFATRLWLPAQSPQTFLCHSTDASLANVHAYEALVTLLDGFSSAMTSSDKGPSISAATQHQGTRDRSSATPNGPELPDPLRNITNFYAAHRKPWRFTAAEEDHIRKGFDANQSIAKQITKVTRRIAKARIQHIKDPWVSRKLLDGLEDQFKPLVIAGIPVNNRTDLRKALKTYIKVTTLERSKKVLSPKKYAKLRSRKGDPESVDKDIEFYSAYYLDLYDKEERGPTYNPDIDMILVPPVRKKVDEFGIARAIDLMHELEHRTFRWKKHAQSQERSRSWGIGAGVIRAINPVGTIMQMSRVVHEEECAIGAEWELLQRIPPSIRKKALKRLAKDFSNSGIAVTFHASKPYHETIDYLHDRFGHTRYSTMHDKYSLYTDLQRANLGKVTYIARSLEDSDENWKGLIKSMFNGDNTVEYGIPLAIDLMKTGAYLFWLFA